MNVKILQVGMQVKCMNPEPVDKYDREWVNGVITYIGPKILNDRKTYTEIRISTKEGLGCTRYYYIDKFSRHIKTA